MRFWWLLALVACGGTTWEPIDQVDVPSSFTDCSDGSACVVVELGCCDYCNGGAAVSVRADMEQDALDTYGETCNGPVMCTQMGCAPLTAECQQDACVLLSN